MNVVAPRTLRAFWREHPQAETPLRRWHKELRKGQFQNFSELREHFASADYISEQELTIFNIGGNAFRLVAFVRYTSQTVFIKKIMTHAEYDKWNRQGRPI